MAKIAPMTKTIPNKPITIFSALLGSRGVSPVPSALICSWVSPSPSATSVTRRISCVIFAHSFSVNSFPRYSLLPSISLYFGDPRERCLNFDPQALHSIQGLKVLPTLVNVFLPPQIGQPPKARPVFITPSCSFFISFMFLPHYCLIRFVSTC